MVFVDTNILLYAAANEPAERPKSLTARHILETEPVAVSAQVLQEFYWNATRPHKLGFDHEQAMTFIDVWKMFPFQPTTIAIIEDALFLSTQFRIGYWDAAIIAAARHLDCDILYTEDLNDGQNYEGVVAINPFNH